MMSCASCGETIPPSESDLPCSRCGSADRNLAVADYGAVADEVMELDAQFPRAPAAWQQMWAEVQHNLGVLRRWYSGGQGMNVTELRADSLAFFVSCYHLKEHIKGRSGCAPADAGPSEWPRPEQPQPPAGSRHRQHLQAQQAKQRPSLQHRQGRHPPHRINSDLRLDRRTGRSCSADCLDLAEQAVDAWSDFLRSHNLLAP